MDYEQFKVPVYKLTHVDLDCYKERQMKRRIDALIQKHRLKGYEEFIEAITNDKNLFEEFMSYITINVSEFYRNPEQWRVLESEILPNLIKNAKGKLKVWSAACSTGDEPYSLAMLIKDYLPTSEFSILATDLDVQIIEKAKVGVYGEKSLAGLPKKYKDKYFTKLGEKSYQISDEIKKCVTFQRHDLLKDVYPEPFDLILCRNVVIYFTDEAKNRIYTNFNKSLNKNGVLFVGSTEQIINYRELNYLSNKSFFYKKNSTEGLS